MKFFRNLIGSTAIIALVFYACLSQVISIRRRPVPQKEISLPLTPIPLQRSQTPPKTKTYAVQRGDSLSKIAQTFGTTVETLAALNQLANINILEELDKF